MNKENIYNAKILIVDDNLKNLQLLGAILNEAGYFVGVASNGQQALSQIVRKNDYDLIILDISMPVIDGFETCKAIRANPVLNEVPVFFLTSANEPNSIVKGFESGAQDYITKPFNTKELLFRINTHLQLKTKNETIKRLNQELEFKVLERTNELVRANDKLEILDKAKGDFLKLLSHELRTPLNGIIGMAEILIDDIENSEHKLFVKSIIESAERLAIFSEIAMLITRLKIKTYEIEFRTHGIDIIIDKAVSALEQKLVQKKITVVKNVFDDKISVSVDIDLLYRVIENILDNAIRASPEGGIIRVEREIHDGFIVTTVKDEGKGFEQDTLKNLFELFLTTDIMHHSDGLGLGLASVKLIMDIHKGKVEIKNGANGAEVSISIPLINDYECF